MRYELLHADCRDVMANMGDETVDAVVTDPPYHLTSIVKRFGPGQAPAQFGTDGAFARAARGFMGQEWDGGDIAFDPALWAECLRVLKPGGHLIAFSGSRTYHRMAYAIDLAGFEIRDQLLWLYGSGFPKSHDVGKALRLDEPRPYCANGGMTGLPGNACENGMNTGLAHPEREQWRGWGTALKPAHEPMVLARKPLAGTVAANVLAHGVGALNIDGCRVPIEPTADTSQIRVMQRNARTPDGYGMGETENAPVVRPEGRFPANVLHDGSEAVVSAFPARFFYCAKASKADREAGCAALAAQEAGIRNGSGRRLSLGDDPSYTVAPRANIHPTVKPTDLMRWLVRLITPPGGLVFDPFTGSGSTGRAAMLEGCRFVGAEMTAEYIPIAHARIMDACD